MAEKINDDASGFAEMVADAPISELDRLGRRLGELSVDVDELKAHRATDEPAAIVQSLMQLGQRVKAIEDFLNQRQAQENIQQQQLERHTRAQALDGAIKMCPTPSSEADLALLKQAYDFCLRLLRGGEVH